MLPAVLAVASVACSAVGSVRFALRVAFPARRRVFFLQRRDLQLVDFAARFRSHSDSDERVELIVLIHPTVLKTPEIAAATATNEKNHMPAIKAAEREDILDDNRRQKEADKIKVPTRD